MGRLNQTTARRQLLESLVYMVSQAFLPISRRHPRDWQKIKVALIPNNMDLIRQKERRSIRPSYFNKKQKRELDQMHAYTDVTGANNTWAIAYWNILNRSYTKSNMHFPKAEEAEIYAIGKTISHLSQPTRPLNIYRDSKKACRIIASRDTPQIAAYLCRYIQGTVKIYWIPGHAGILGNEKANELAREAHYRAPRNGGETPSETESSPRQLHLKDYMTARQQSPQPH